MLTRLAAPPDPTPSTGAHVETVDPDLKVCTGEQCKTLTPKVLPGSSPIHAATNSDGTLAVVLLGDAARGKGYAEIWDVAAGKKTQTFRYAQGDFRCGTVHFVGQTIFVSASTCNSPDAHGQLFSAKGKRIAAVGARDFGTFGDAFAPLDGNQWAFLGENGTRIAVQDVVKGKVVKTIDLSLLWRKDGEPDNTSAFGNPGESALLKLAGSKVAVIAGSPARHGSVAVVDLATGEVTASRTPRCCAAERQLVRRHPHRRRRGSVRCPRPRPRRRRWSAR